MKSSFHPCSQLFNRKKQSKKEKRTEKVDRIYQEKEKTANKCKEGTEGKDSNHLGDIIIMKS